MQNLGHDLTVITSTPKVAYEGIATAHFNRRWDVSGASELIGLVKGSRPDALVVQYVPHAYSERGGGLAVALLLRRLARSISVPMVVNAHEVYGAWTESAKRIPWHLSQRFAAVILASSAEAFVVTIKRRQGELKRFLWPWTERVKLIQIGPTVPAHAPDPDWRRRHGVADGTFLMTSFGLGHPTQAVTQLSAVLDTLAAGGVNARLFIAGRLDVVHPLVTHLGYVSSEDAYQLLAAGDVFVLPLADGVSSRRSSVISALAVGAAVATTAGRDTDLDLFCGGGVAMSPSGDPDAFAELVLQLATNAEARAGVTRLGRELFSSTFAWPVVGNMWAELLEQAAEQNIRKRKARNVWLFSAAIDRKRVNPKRFRP
ncbi:glycosyltransferase [Cryobacterium ruanii]|uniref:Glycosyltransferase n=2 Tax=Cryobacterium ruanii TaxID=1259197 RepID=A0A4R9AQ47_9MICO|nr:glycosyltransferase [Cryobacterium ruanii]TFD66517.1 glycosyltransferase [Cryobacterium ruanii]